VKRVAVEFDEKTTAFIARSGEAVATASTQVEAVRALAVVLAERDPWSRRWAY
jgi:hypothetical protein